MATEVKVDGSGRMVIPVRLRRSLGLGNGGGTVVLDESADGIILQPRPGARAAPAIDEHGLVVLDLGRRVGVDEVAVAVAADRDRRD